MFLRFVSGQGQRVAPTIGDGFYKPQRCDAAQADFGKPDGSVNIRVGMVFINHEEHEAREENTKVGVLVLPM